MLRRSAIALTGAVLFGTLASFAGSALSSAAGRQVPVLGRSIGIFVGGRGFGQVHPALIDNGGDPTGRVTGIRWKTWGGPQAVGTGTGWVSGESVAQGSYHTATVVAFDLGHCARKLMYEALTWYFPDQGESFDPKSCEDICTGQYVDLTCLSYRHATQVFVLSHHSGAAIRDVSCDGSTWASGSVVDRNQQPLGEAMFHLTMAGWSVVAVSYGQVTEPPTPNQAAYCRALVQAHAPAELQCGSTAQG